MKRVVFVDDDPLVLAGLKRQLRDRREEWRMEFVDSGEAALATCEAEPADVVVSDMRMPKMDGAALLAAVRDRWPDAVRIVLSGQSDQEAVLRCIGPAHRFLSKPCSADELRDAIARASAVKDRLRAGPIRELTARVEHLPSVPRLYERLTAELRKPDASIDRVAETVSGDPAMCARLLQLVNSSFFGLPQRVTRIAHAVNLLGIGLLKAMTLSAGVFCQPGMRSIEGLSLDALVEHSLRVASLARCVAMDYDGDPTRADDAVLAGMLHDVGKAILATGFPGEYAATIRESRRLSAPLHEVERQRFGADHAEIGAFLLELWGLPTSIVEAVAFHHRPELSLGRAFDTLTAVHAAESLVDDPTGEFGLRAEYLERVGCAAREPAWRRLARSIPTAKALSA